MVEFLGISVEAVFVLALVAVSVHTLAAPSSTSQTDNPRTPSDDLDSEVTDVSGAMYVTDGLGSWAVEGGNHDTPTLRRSLPGALRPSLQFTLPRGDV